MHKPVTFPNKSRCPSYLKHSCISLDSLLNNLRRIILHQLDRPLSTHALEIMMQEVSNRLIYNQVVFYLVSTYEHEIRSTKSQNLLTISIIINKNGDKKKIVELFMDEDIVTKF